MPRNLYRVAVVVLAASLSFGDCPSPSWAEDFSPLVLVTGTRVASRLRGIQDRQVTFETAAGIQQFDLEDVVWWGSPAENQLGHQVQLDDGGVLVGELVAVSSQEVVLATRWFGQVRLPRDSIAGLVLRSPSEALARDRLQRRLQASPRIRDSVWLANGDELNGSTETVEPIRPDSSPTVLRVGPANSHADIENVVAVAFATPRAVRQASRATRLWIGFRDGTRIAVGLPLVTEPRVEFSHSDELKFLAVGNDIWEHVSFLQPMMNRSVYLSDQPVVGYKHIPFLSQTWQLGLDQNVLGGRLRGSGRTYLKGLGMHSTSRVAFNLARRFRWLEADLAVDDAAAERGAVVFRVFVGQAEAESLPPWKLAYESPIVRGGKAPLPIRIDLQGAERLALVVDFAERGDEGDYANWLNARVIP